MATPSILFYAHAYKGHGRDAGAETTAHDTLKALADRGWRVQVLLTNGTYEYELDGINVRSARNLQEFPQVANDYTVVMSHLECSEQAALFCRSNKIPMVHLVHNTLWQTSGYLEENCDLAIYNTDWVAQFHDEYDHDAHLSLSAVRLGGGLGRLTLKVPKQKRYRGVVLHPLIDPTEYIGDGIAGPHDCITYVNFFKNKGANVFFEMANRFPHLPFLGVEGGYGEQEIPETLPDNVEIVENTKDMASIYARSKIILMPSKYESFGRVAIEAAAQGVPTIASPTDGLREALGPNGIYADYRDMDAWELCISGLLSPARYATASREALRVSKMWADKREFEIERLEAALFDVARRKLRWG